MATTRTPQTLEMHLCLAAERPRLFFAYGMGERSVWFDDVPELRATLSAEARACRIPEWVVEPLVVYAKAKMGTYEDTSRSQEVTEVSEAQDAPGFSHWPFTLGVLIGAYVREVCRAVVWVWEFFKGGVW
jgi:hypothetical protein